MGYRFKFDQQTTNRRPISVRKQPAPSKSVLKGDEARTSGGGRKMKFRACSVILVSTLMGCSTFSGTPDDSLDSERDFSSTIIDVVLDSERIETILQRGATRFERNEIVYARLSEIDLLYFDYENEISREFRDTNFVAAILGIGLGGAGSLTSGLATQALSAASGFVSGTHEALTSEVLVNQTIQALQEQMRASRATVREQIVFKLNGNVVDYPLTAALSDLAAYQQAGTLAGALLELTGTAAEEELAATDALRSTERDVLSVQYGTNETTDILSAFIENRTVSQEERQRRAALFRQLVESRQAGGVTECTLQPDMLLYSDPSDADLASGCRQLQIDILDNLRTLGEI